ncbi:MAG TPA: TylF/MycF/NovP-related O-methyltransferase [Xanthobacteraceae bacterium]
MRRVLRKVAREVRRPFRPRPPRPQRLGDEPQWIRDIVERVIPFTLTSHERIAALCNAVEYIVRSDIPGDIVECGVWRGGSMMAAALSLLHLGDTDRNLYLFDTFTGMTAPTSLDRRISDGTPAADLLEASRREGNNWGVPAQDVRRNIVSTSYPVSRICLVEGRVEDTVPASAPKEIALLRLDTDWYESTHHELIHLYPRVTPAGVLIIDDYGFFTGARKAVDEYIAGERLPILLHNIDGEGRIAVKISRRDG